MEQIRVFELARELGLTSPHLKAELRRRGETLLSTASVISPPMVTAMRRAHPSRPSRYPRPGASPISRGQSQPSGLVDVGDDFASAVAAVKMGVGENDPTKLKRTSGVWKGDLPTKITQVLLDVAIVPRRSPKSKLPKDKYYADEIDRARQLHNEWAAAQLDCPNLSEDTVVAWIRLTGGSEFYAVKKLARAGITPEDAKLRLAFNRLDPTADPIFYRVLKGHMSVKDAANQLNRWKKTGTQHAI